MHVRYMNEYATTYNKCRFRLSLLAVFIAVLCQSTVTISVNTIQGNRKAFPFVLTVNIIIFITVVILYGKTIGILKAHKRENRSLSSDKRNIVKLSTVYLYLYVLIQGFLLVHLMVLSRKHSLLSVQGKNFFNVFYAVIPSFSGVVNGFAFLMINRRSRILLRQAFPLPFETPTRNDQIELPNIPNQWEDTEISLKRLIPWDFVLNLFMFHWIYVILFM